MKDEIIMPEDVENCKPDLVERKRKQLKFRSWHRGTREMDIILGAFADQNLGEFDQEALNQYEDLLSYSDPDLYNWLSGAEAMPANVDSDVMRLFLTFNNG